jgi:hypothetical protein
MHESPEIANRKEGKKPKLVIQKISLMAMHDKDLLPGFSMLQDQRFMDVDVRKQILVGFAKFVKTAVKIVFQIGLAAKLAIVVAIKKNHASVSEKLLQHVEGSDMGGINMLEPRLL